MLITIGFYMKSFHNCWLYFLTVQTRSNYFDLLHRLMGLWPMVRESFYLLSVVLLPTASIHRHYEIKCFCSSVFVNLFPLSVFFYDAVNKWTSTRMRRSKSSTHLKDMSTPGGVGSRPLYPVRETLLSQGHSFSCPMEHRLLGYCTRFL